MCRWEKDEQERRLKEEGKREKTALATWRKLVMGLRIIQRVREEYGGDTDAHIAEEMNPFTNPSTAKKALQAETGTGSMVEGGPFSYGIEEDIGGGFLPRDDDPDRGGFSPEGRDAVEIRHMAVGELAIEGERDPVDSKPLSGPPSTDSVRKNRGPPRNDVCQELLIQSDLKGNAMVFPKPLTNGSEAAATVTSPKWCKDDVPIDSPRRTAPKRKAARQSETALSQLFEQEDDDFSNSVGEDLKSREPAVEESAKRKKIKNGSDPSARAKKRRS